MDKNLKVCLIVAGVMVFVLGLVVIGSGTLLYLNWDKVTQGAQKVVDNLEKQADDGREFGESTDQQGCLDEALERSEGKGAFTSILPSTFFTGCVEAASVTEGFCEGAPDATQILSMATWPQGQCVAMGKPNNQGCLQVMQAKLEYCIENQPE